MAGEPDLEDRWCAVGERRLDHQRGVPAAHGSADRQRPVTRQRVENRRQVVEPRCVPIGEGLVPNLVWNVERHAIIVVARSPAGGRLPTGVTSRNVDPIDALTRADVVDPGDQPATAEAFEAYSPASDLLGPDLPDFEGRPKLGAGAEFTRIWFIGD